MCLFRRKKKLFKSIPREVWEEAFDNALKEKELLGPDPEPISKREWRQIHARFKAFVKEQKRNR